MVLNGLYYGPYMGPIWEPYLDHILGSIQTLSIPGLSLDMGKWAIYTVSGYVTFGVLRRCPKWVCFRPHLYVTISDI